MTFDFPPGHVVGFVLALVRASAWLMVAPPFNTRAIPAQVKVGMAAALALPAAPVLAKTAPPIDVVPLVGAIVLQVFMGLTLGFLVMLLFTAVQAAGDMVDMFAGFSVAQVLDPLSQNVSSLFGRFYNLIAVTLLFAVDGHLLVVRGFVTSFESVSVRLPPLEDAAGLFMHSLSTFMLAAVEIGAPILGALFLAEVAMGLLSRAAPQMNVFLLGIPFKILLTLMLMGVALPLLPGGLTSVLEQGVRSSMHFVDLVGGG